MHRRAADARALDAVQEHERVKDEEVSGQEGLGEKRMGLGPAEQCSGLAVMSEALAKPCSRRAEDAYPRVRPFPCEVWFRRPDGLEVKVRVAGRAAHRRDAPDEAGEGLPARRVNQTSGRALGEGCALRRGQPLLPARTRARATARRGVPRVRGGDRS